MNLLEMTLFIPISTFTQGQLDSLVQKMTLLLKDDVKVNVTRVKGQVDTGNTQLIFFLSKEVGFINNYHDNVLFLLSSLKYSVGGVQLTISVLLSGIGD